MFIARRAGKAQRSTGARSRLPSLKIRKEARYLKSVKMGSHKRSLQAGRSCYFVVPFCETALAVCLTLGIMKSLVDVRLRGNTSDNGKGDQMIESKCRVQQTIQGLLQSSMGHVHKA